MKKIVCLVIAVFLILSSLFLVESIYGNIIKELKVGKYWTKATDSGDQSAAILVYNCGFYYFDGFSQPHNAFRGWYLGTKDWYDEDDNYVPYKMSGCAQANSDEEKEIMPLMDENGITIYRYYRYTPPSITVDGTTLEDPFPRLGDSVDANAILGTADVMVESWFNTSMGLTVHQRVLAWSQANHDDYVIFDWILINTGNIDKDEYIELPNQTLDSVYFLKDPNLIPLHSWHGPMWGSVYGQHPGDSIRVIYWYDGWDDVGYDNYGESDPQTGRLWSSIWQGETYLHCDVSPDDHSDNPAQPQMTGFQNYAGACGSSCFYTLMATSEDAANVYGIMRDGFKPYDGTLYIQDVGETVYPGTHHTLRMDQQGYKYPTELPWFYWHPYHYTSVGPYTVAPGDSFRIVWAEVMGSITPEKSKEIGRQWLNGTCTWPGSDNLPPPAQDNPDLIPTPNDWAKDCWMTTGRDSLYKNSRNAKWAVDNNYDVPIPPPPPSIVVSSLPDKVLIEWGNESEAASDLAGYRVYRAVGKQDSTLTLIYETTDLGVLSFEDADADRGIAYFYCVTAFDDGSDPPGVNGMSEVHESGKYLNLTSKAAYLTRPPGDELSDIRIVPNPYNVGARGLQYPGEPDKIMFLNLPPECTIKIYNESLDLIKTIEHTDGSGDEAWGDLLEEHLTSETGQIVVSGIYIAHIETPDGRNTNVKFLVVR